MTSDDFDQGLLFDWEGGEEEPPPDDLLKIIRMYVDGVITDSPLVKTAFEAFTLLDAILTAGGELPADWAKASRPVPPRPVRDVPLPPM